VDLGWGRGTLGCLGGFCDGGRHLRGFVCYVVKKIPRWSPPSPKSKYILLPHFRRRVVITISPSIRLITSYLGSLSTIHHFGWISQTAIFLNPLASPFHTPPASLSSSNPIASLLNKAPLTSPAEPIQPVESSCSSPQLHESAENSPKAVCCAPD